MKGDYMFKKSDFEKTYYKTGDVAELVNLHQRTIQAYCDSGIIGHIRTATNIRLIPKEALLSFLAKQGLLAEDRYSVGYIRVTDKKYADALKAKLIMSAVSLNPVNFKIKIEENSDDSVPRHELDAILQDITDGNIDKLFILNKDAIGSSYYIVEHLCQMHNTKLVNIEELNFEN